jgi:hypothetical protein
MSISVCLVIPVFSSVFCILRCSSICTVLHWVGSWHTSSTPT